MREDQSKRHSNFSNPGKDTTRWHESDSSRDEYSGKSWDRMNQSNNNDQYDQDTKYTGQSYRNDDRGINMGRSAGQYGQQDSSWNSQSPYERASYGRDTTDNFSNSDNSRGGQGSQERWNQPRRESGFGQSNQQDQSYGQQYGRSYGSSFSGSQQDNYGNSSYGSGKGYGSDSYQPRGADQGSYGQDTGANSRFQGQGGYPYGYDANRSGSSYDSSRSGDNYRMNRSSDSSSSRYQGESDRNNNYQGHFQGWDQNQQNYRGNDAQRSIYGSAGFGSLGTGNESLRARSSNNQGSSSNYGSDYNSGYNSNYGSGRSDSDRGYNAQNSRISTTYHPDAHYGATGSSQSGSSSYYNSSDSNSMNSYSNNLSGKQTPASYYGKGPKSFKRSDDRIREELSEMFTRHHDVDASDIEIEVKDGEVTLSGQVPERRMKYLAEDLAEKSMGVKDVTNNLRVRREGSMFGSSQSSDSMSSSSNSDSLSMSSDSDKGDKKTNLSSKDSSKKGSTLNPNH